MKRSVNGLWSYQVFVFILLYFWVINYIDYISMDFAYILNAIFDQGAAIIHCNISFMLYINLFCENNWWY